MNLEEHYNQLHSTSAAKIKAGDYQIDPLLSTENDHRFGITLVARPDEQTKAKIQSFLSEVKEVEPHQYYYQNSDIHITVMSIISCYVGFKLEKIEIQDYIEIVNNVLKKYKSFSVQFKGLTASPAGILLQGFSNDDTLNEIRDELRLEFRKSQLEQSIDQRYAIQTLHSTIIRFKQELADKTQFLNFVENYRNFDFGTFEVKNIELVFNDWYQRAKHVKKLHVFELSS
ncbi:MAG: mutarotase [Flavobacterium sp.]|nr:MAG: mutarotase [Flavobacterium sp.]